MTDGEDGGWLGRFSSSYSDIDVIRQEYKNPLFFTIGFGSFNRNCLENVCRQANGGTYMVLKDEEYHNMYLDAKNE